MRKITVCQFLHVRPFEQTGGGGGGGGEGQVDCKQLSPINKGCLHRQENSRYWLVLLSMEI